MNGYNKNAHPYDVADRTQLYYDKTAESPYNDTKILDYYCYRSVDAMMKELESLKHPYSYTNEQAKAYLLVCRFVYIKNRDQCKIYSL